MFSEKIFKGILFTAILFALIIITSQIIGFYWLNSGLILVVSTLTALFFVKKFSVKIDAEAGVLILAVLLLVLLAYPLILLMHFYPASNDAVSTTMLRILEGKIPFTHEPYSKINLSYPLGFPLVANAFSETIPFVPDYLWTWIIGLCAGLFQLVFFSLFASEVFKNKKAGLLAAAVFLCTKYVFENFYVGEMGWYMGTAFALCFMYLHLKKSRLQYLLFPVIFITHPLAGFNFLIIFGLYKIFFGFEIKQIAKLGLSLILTAPLIIMSYGPIVYNIFFSNTKLTEFSLRVLIDAIIALPFWVGSGLTILTIVALIASAKKKKIFVSKEQLFFFAMLFLSLALFALFSYSGFMLSGRVLEVTMISMALISANLISKHKFWDKRMVLTITIVVLIALLFFFTSSKLEHYRQGSKINENNIEFAEKFYQFDPSLKRSLILSNESGKIAEYANKIPFDLNSAHPIISFDFVYYQTEALKNTRKDSQTQIEIIKNQRTDLIEELDVYYIAVDKNYFLVKIDYPIVFEYKNFVVYKK